MKPQGWFCRRLLRRLAKTRISDCPARQDRSAETGPSTASRPRYRIENAKRGDPSMPRCMTKRCGCAPRIKSRCGRAAQNAARSPQIPGTITAGTQARRRGAVPKRSFGVRLANRPCGTSKSAPAPRTGAAARALTGKFPQPPAVSDPLLRHIGSACPISTHCSAVGV